MILDAGDNVSDHLPIMFKISCKTMADPPQSETRTKPPSLKWEKCSDEQKNSYTNYASVLSSQYPSRLTKCNVVHCTDSRCIASIEVEYDTIIKIVTMMAIIITTMIIYCNYQDNPIHRDNHQNGDDFTEYRRMLLSILSYICS